jgi:hypothetical protein
MSDLPELSESTKRRLKIQWDTLLDKHLLTEEHVAKHDHNRNQLLATTPSRRTPNWARAKQAAGNFGLDPSVRVAEVRFREIDHEYWTKWCSRGMTYEIYAGWLEIIRREVCAEVESIWKGRSNLTDCWFQTTCAPAIGKALARLVKLRIAQARDVEVQRLERAPSRANLATGTPPPEATLQGGDNLGPATQGVPEPVQLQREEVASPTPTATGTSALFLQGVTRSVGAPIEPTISGDAAEQETSLLPDNRFDFASGTGRNKAVDLYTVSWKCPEASLARTALVHPADLSKWKKGLLPAESDKKARIEKSLTNNAAPTPAPRRSTDC